ncbi:hypothetical protein ACFTAO_25540 [Paenibacillus rhizoplanae]
MLKRKYGEGSDVYRVRVQGQFPRGEAGTFITLEAAEHAAKEVQIKVTGTTLVIGVDVARYGDDETAMYAGIGKKDSRPAKPLQKKARWSRWEMRFD